MPNALPIIDMWLPIVPSKEIMEHVAYNFPEPQKGYLAVFFKQEPDLEAYKHVALARAVDDEAIIASA